MKIFCMGNASYDITMPIKEYPKENNKYRIEKRIECSGGPACNAARLLGNWKQETYFIGIVGNDTYGKTIKQELEGALVNTTYLSIDKNCPTTLSIVIPNISTASRTIITNRDINMNLGNIEIKEIPDIILMDGQEYETSMNLLEKHKNVISIMDAGKINENIINLGKKANYLVCSKKFAEDYTNIEFNINDFENIKKIYKILKNDFKNEIIITLEENGVLYLYNNELKIMPTIKVSSLDTTGAGDIFHGAFAYCIAKKYDVEKSIKISNIAAALSTRNIGNKNSIPNLDEVMKIYEGI